MRLSILFVCLVVVINPDSVLSQSVNSKQAAFAGGGFSLISGPSALFVSPANMMINTYGFGTQIEFGTFFSETGIISNLPNSFSAFEESFLYSSLYNTTLEPKLDASILSNKGNTTLSISALQASFIFDDWSIGFALRTRINSNFAFTQNFYPNSTINQNLRSFESESTQWNEYSIGFARSLDYFNLINSNFNRFFVGFSISLLQPFSHDKTTLNQELSVNSNNENTLISSSSLSYAGYISPIFNRSQGSTSSINPIGLGDLTESKGFGSSINLSLTYEIPFESTYKQVIDGKPITKFWRFSLALTDLGFMRFNDGISTLNADKDTLSTSINSFQPVYNQPFSYSINDRIRFLQDPTVQTMLQRAELANEVTATLYLPTQLKAGFVLSYQWIRLGSDVFYGLNTSMNNTTSICLTGFSEVTLIPFLPIRAGVLLKDFKPTQVSTGLGLDIWHLSWDASFVYSTDSLSLDQPKAFAATGLRLRF